MNFLEIYKKIDNFCKDAYNSTSGITTYINEMEKLRYEEWYGIEWQKVYNNLRYYRDLRNKVIHESGYNEDMFSTNDIIWLESFYKMLLNRNDPISLRCSKKKVSIKNKKNTHNTQTYFVKEKTKSNVKNKKNLLERIKQFFKNIY